MRVTGFAVRSPRRELVVTSIRRGFQEGGTTNRSINTNETKEGVAISASDSLQLVELIQLKLEQLPPRSLIL